MLSIAAVVSGCAAEGGPAPVPTPGYSSTYQPAEPTVLAPLRGTSVAAGTLTHASVAAKIDNHWDARPQLGLERTDIVFEELVEGGITRYVAIWHSDMPDAIGPVRSIRPMDPDIASPFGGIIFYAGGQERFVTMMRKTPVYSAIHGQSDTAAFMYRATDRRAPHNVIAKAKEFVTAHADIVAPTQQFAYSLDAASSTAAKEGAPTATLQLTFSPGFRPAWTYDAATSRYLRLQDGAPDLDSTGAQLSTTNVVSMRVPVVTSQGIPKTEMLGSGEVWVTTGGATVHGTWHKATATAPIQLMDDSGIAIRLAAGNTWVELVPTAGAVEMIPPSA
jgi:hypothetical protein